MYIDVFYRMIEKLQSDMVTLQLLLRWIRECCIKHELNRQMIFNARILEKMKAMLLQENVPDSVIKEVCGVLRALTLDDDVRHEFGKAHEHAAAIARSTLTILTRLLFSKQGYSISFNCDVSNDR